MIIIKTTSPYSAEYISGHNPNGMTGRKHTQESKRKMSKPKGKRT